MRRDRVVAASCIGGEIRCIYGSAGLVFLLRVAAVVTRRSEVWCRFTNVLFSAASTIYSDHSCVSARRVWTKRTRRLLCVIVAVVAVWSIPATPVGNEQGGSQSKNEDDANNYAGDCAAREATLPLVVILITGGGVDGADGIRGEDAATQTQDAAIRRVLCATGLEGNEDWEKSV